MSSDRKKVFIVDHADLGETGSRSHKDIDTSLNSNIPSNPPAGKQKIINMYYDPSDGSIGVDVET
jgi:hypothetical protein